MLINDRIRIGNLELSNRLVMPPMATWKQSETGIPDELVQYYADRAGKIGLIEVEYAYISEEGKAGPGQLSIAKDFDIGELQKITDAVHAKGTTKVFAQINHAGTAGGYEVGGQDDIDRIIKCFADASVRAKKAGFDGVEIHASHGYLLNQFYSPLKNLRTDAYGAQTIENRTRLSAEVIKAVRAAVGADYPVGIRFGGCDYQEGGSTLEEAPAAAKIYEAAGADMISISGGVNGFMIQGVDTPGWFGDLSKVVKDVVNIPVLLTGGIRNREESNTFLADGKADLIGIGRPLLQQNYEEVLLEVLG